jgi:hypothetical protein
MNGSLVLFLLCISSAAADHDEDHSMYDLIQFLFILGAIALTFAVCSTSYPGLDYPLSGVERSGVVRVQIVGQDVPRECEVPNRV